jgi:hypothetical protein
MMHTMRVSDNAWEIGAHQHVNAAQLDAMYSSDGQAQGLYRLLTLPLRAAARGATFVPQSGQVGGDREAEFAHNLLFAPKNAGGMVSPFGLFFAQIIQALRNGNSAFEFTYQMPKTGPMKNKWTIRKLGYRPAQSINRYLVDVKRQYEGHDHLGMVDDVLETLMHRQPKPSPRA